LEETALSRAVKLVQGSENVNSACYGSVDALYFLAV